MKASNLITQLSIFSTKHLLPVVEEKGGECHETAELIRVAKANLSSNQSEVRSEARVLLIALAAYLSLKE